jgi:hypothetical protein
MTLDQAIKRLRELNEPVPKPGRLPTEAEVAAIEKELGVRLHADLRKYLLTASDIVYGTKEPATITDRDGHTNLATMCQTAWEELDVPRDLVPFCEDNGDYFCINKRGQVVLWSADGATDEKWPNLATWIEEVWIGESEEDE